MAINKREFGGEMAISEVLAPLEDSYDFVILDTAPGWDTLTINVLFYAQEVLSPVSLEVLTLQGLLDFSRNLSAIQKYHPSLTLRYVLPTFLDRRVRKSEEILSQLESHFPEQICAPIRYNVRLSEAPGYGQTIFEFAPQSPGAEDYRRLTERILNDGRA
jgi:chromosome partitioning protein